MSLWWGFKGGISSANDMLREDQTANKEWWAPGEPLGLKGREGVAGTWLGLWQGTAGWSSGQRKKKEQAIAKLRPCGEGACR